MTNIERRDKDERYKQLLDAAICLAEEKGYKSLTRAAVAEAAGVSPGLVNHYFGHIHDLQNTVIQTAILQEILPILAQGLVGCHPEVQKLPGALYDRVVDHISDLRPSNDEG